MKVAVLALLVIAALGVLALQPTGSHAASPGTTVAPLLSCPNVDASADDRVGVADIIAVTQAYSKNWPSLDYHYLFDLVAPYNKDTGQGGQQRIDDVLAVTERYYDVCPHVDTEVAAATRWAIENVSTTEDATALASIGYYHASTDVPGQGQHYVKFSNYDGAFDPRAPEGLVYDDGRLAAQLYVIDGSSIGWVEDYQSPQNPGGPCWDGIDNGNDGSADIADPDCGSGDPAGQPLDDVNIDPLCNHPACSWTGSEGWHLHYRLCTIHIGTPFAAALPMSPGSDDSDCQQLQTSTAGNACGEGAPICWAFNRRVGWMGHLWNHLPNSNEVSDVNGTMSGRFADCYPDGGIWKAYNCPQ
jgi:hypothetical protein